MVTKAQFDSAAQRLIGAEVHAALLRSGLNDSDMCQIIARNAFIGKLEGTSIYDSDLALVKQVATRLWTGDGTTGLTD